MKNEKRKIKKLAATLAVLAAGSVFYGTVPADAKETKAKSPGLERLELALRYRTEIHEGHDDFSELRFRNWRRIGGRKDWFDDWNDFPPHFRDRPPMPPRHRGHMPPPPNFKDRPPMPPDRRGHMPPSSNFKGRPPMPPRHGGHMPQPPRGRR